jgi:hypothetical protein
MVGGDVGIGHAAARRITPWTAPGWVRTVHRGDHGMEHVTLNPLDRRLDLLAGDGAGDEDDAPVVPGDHASADGDLLDVEGELRARSDHRLAPGPLVSRGRASGAAVAPGSPER